MKSNGEKEDRDPHTHVHHHEERKSSKASLLARKYRHYHHDKKYHIDDYFIESQNIFGTDFIENRYSFPMESAHY